MTEWMHEAYREALLAAEEGEVPVGCVIVRDGEVIAAAHNTREASRNALCHAELIAIHRACERLGGWRLIGCKMYVTLEPCPMCAGAILNAQLKEIVVGAGDERMGAFGGLFDLREKKGLFRSEVSFGDGEEECRALMQAFFRGLREKREERNEKKDRL